MTQSLVELAKELTLALVQSGTVSAEDMQATLEKTYATLATLKAQDESETPAPEPAAQAPVGNWRKSIGKQTITCLACGEKWKQLSNRHLQTHGLDSRTYRAQYGIPQTQALAARATTDRRRQLVRAVRPWEKSPQYRKKQARNGHPSPELVAEEARTETEETVAGVGSPKQRKTTPKKKASRKTRSHG
jgi:predicted transcriptional regulator